MDGEEFVSNLLYSEGGELHPNYWEGSFFSSLRIMGLSVMMTTEVIQRAHSSWG